MHISPTNKRYIGISCKKIQYRWQNGEGYKNQPYFYRAIKKYGWDNFEHIIIARGLTEDEAKWLEVELIREWDTTNPNKGYNLTKGGDGCSGYKHTEESKQKISKANSGRTSSMKGKQHTEETKRKMSENHADFSGDNNPNYGKHLSKETKEKISKTNGGKNNPNAKKVICITTNEIFETMTEGARKYNCSVGHICNCCNGKLKSCGKLEDGTPLIWMYYKNYLKLVDK